MNNYKSEWKLVRLDIYKGLFYFAQWISFKMMGETYMMKRTMIELIKKKSSLDLHLVCQLTQTDHCHFPPFYKQQLLDLRLISCQTYSDPCTKITSNIYFGWLAIKTIDEQGNMIRLLRKIECTFASQTLSINGFMERRVLSRINCEPEIR